MNAVIEFLKNYTWIVEVAFILLGAFLMYVFVERILKFVLPRLQKTKVVWDEAFLKALGKPFNYFVIFWAVFHSIRIATQHVHTVSFPLSMDTLETLAYTSLFIWFAMRFIRFLENDIVRIRIEKGQEVDQTSVRAVAQLIRIIVLLLAGFIAMQAMGVSVSAVLTFGGAGALAVALAAKELLGNLFGGLMIFLDRPFSVGDWIRSPDKEVEGTVEHIGWRLTRIRTFDKRPLYVPNGIFSSISIQNPSRMTNRRIKADIGVRYDDAVKVEEILLDCEKMLNEHEEIDNNQTTFVNLIEFGQSSLNFQVYCFTKTTNWVKFQQIQQDVFLKIIEIITRHGAECAFPTRTLHFSEGVPVHQ